jgi:hypothetical protein
MTFLDKVKCWLAQIVEVGLLLVALGIVVQVLIGPKVAFIGDVVANLLALIKALGDSGLVGLIAIAIIMWLFSKRSPG